MSEATIAASPAIWLRRALWLVVITAAYNLVEAGVALRSGVVSGSIALVGFGLDSLIELSASAVLIWRLRAQLGGRFDDDRLEVTESRVHRFVGITFFLLAVYVTVVSVRTLWLRDNPAESVVGIVLAAVSLLVMPLLAWRKLRAASALDSGALRAEAKETLACVYLSFTLLLGLTLNALFGWWWADPVAALVMVPWLVREGREGFEE